MSVLTDWSGSTNILPGYQRMRSPHQRMKLALRFIVVWRSGILILFGLRSVNTHHFKSSRCYMCIRLGRTFSIFESRFHQSTISCNITCRHHRSVLFEMTQFFTIRHTQHTPCHIYDCSRLYNDTWTWYTSRYYVRWCLTRRHGDVLTSNVLESFCI